MKDWNELHLIDSWDEWFFQEKYEVKIYEDEKGEIWICAIPEEEWSMLC
jgi:hypothetical protein